ncbi:DUF397 domain-containing protein [Actinoallomurus vinaceus]
MKTLDASVISWRKSSASTNTGGQCVEVAAVPSMAASTSSRS